MKTPNLISRRTFLHAAAYSAAAGCLANRGSSTFGAPSSAHWKTAIRDGHLKFTGDTDCWTAMQTLVVTGVEVLVNEKMICPGLFDPAKVHSIESSEACKALQEQMASRGLTITAFAMGNRLEERLPFEVDWMRRVVQAAEQLKVRAIRIDVVPHSMAPDKFLPVAVQACHQLCELVKDRPVRLGVENHGIFTNQPELLDALFHEVGSEQLGLTLDAMNFYWFGHPLNDVYALCEKYASRTFHTHCKNLRYPPEKRDVRRPTGWEYEQHASPVDDGDLEYRRIAAILRKGGYAGDVCLENECLGRFPKDQHVSILRRELAALRALS